MLTSLILLTTLTWIISLLLQAILFLTIGWPFALLIRLTRDRALK